MLCNVDANVEILMKIDQKNIAPKVMASTSQEIKNSNYLSMKVNAMENLQSCLEQHHFV